MSDSEEEVSQNESNSQDDAEEDLDADTIRVLITTDTHIGYLERDPIRKDDSFITWDEILGYADTCNVDMILHGGDLFHDNKPSRKTLYRTMEIIRKHCMGDKEVEIEVVSDFSNNSFGHVNYEDPNYNVKYPMFAVHGNHDDPSGDGAHSALDILSVSNLVNYFGKCQNVDDISVYPVLIEKGNTKLALYGLGYIRDERLYRTFREQKVKFMRPLEEKDKWFSLMTIHQNRVAHSPKNYIHEKFLENFFDLVVWGHEHDCQVVPKQSSEANFYISQPGSSIATSLTEHETTKKHIALLEIKGTQFKLVPIELKTVRPFVMEDVTLDPESLDPTDKEAVREFLEQRVSEMIARVNKERKDKKLPPRQPLIRLRVDHSGGFDTMSSAQFGQAFVGKVANPNEILLFTKKKATKAHLQNASSMDEEAALQSRMSIKPDSRNMEDLINNSLVANGKPSVVLESDFYKALDNFVSKDEKTALTELVNNTIAKTKKYVLDKIKEDTKLERTKLIRAAQKKGADLTQDAVRTKILETRKNYSEEDVEGFIEAHTLRQRTLDAFGLNNGDKTNSADDNGGGDVSMTDAKVKSEPKSRKRKQSSSSTSAPKSKKAKTTPKKPKKKTDFLSLLGDDEDDVKITPRVDVSKPVTNNWGKRKTKK